MRRWLAVIILSVLVFPAAMLAQKPVKNVSKHHHPNIEAAQHLVAQAFNKITAAQEGIVFLRGRGAVPVGEKPIKLRLGRQEFALAVLSAELLMILHRRSALPPAARRVRRVCKAPWQAYGLSAPCAPGQRPQQ